MEESTSTFEGRRWAEKTSCAGSNLEVDAGSREGIASRRFGAYKRCRLAGISP